MDGYKLNVFNIEYLKKLNKIKTTKEVNPMTGYQKLKAAYETAYKALWEMATASPSEWPKFHTKAKEALEEIEGIKNGQKK